MRRITKAALGGVAGCALLLGGMQAASGETLLQQVFPGWLTDLDTYAPADPPADPFDTSGAFDSAKAKLKVIETSDGRSTFSLEVRNIQPGFTGRTFGSHLHTKSCATNSPGLTGGHYQHTQDPNLTTLAEKEVWFALVPDEEGVAVARTVVPFVPKDPDGDGVMSIVIHEGATNPTSGAAGDKEACLPLDVVTWGSDIEPPPVIPTP